MKKLFLFSALAMMSIAATAQTPEAEVDHYGKKLEEVFPAEAEVQDGILVFQNKEKSYEVKFDVRVQSDAAVFFGAPDYADKIGSGMSIRRARFAVKAKLDENWQGEIDTDWTSGTPEIKDAFVEYNGLDHFQLKIGNFKENFSIQRNTTSRYLQFMERPMATYLAPSRHLGINVRYDLPYLWASAGVFGPELEGTEAHNSFETGNKDLGLNEGLSYTGKLVYRPLHKAKNASLHIGAAVSYRNPKLSTGEGYNVVRYSTRNTTGINRKKFLDTDAIEGLDHELAYTFEIAGHWKGLRYEGAYIARQAFLDPVKSSFGELDPAWGWYAQAGYLLFGGSQNYDAGGAKYTRVKRGKEWGDIELCARIEYCDFNISNHYMGGSAYAYSLGLNFHVTENIKFVINYQYNDNDIFANGKGDHKGKDKGAYFTGYDKAGNPSLYPGDIMNGGSGSGIDYHMIACRFQVAF